MQVHGAVCSTNIFEAGLTFDLQPLLIVILLFFIRRLENTQAVGHRRLFGMGVVFDLIQHTAEVGSLPAQGFLCSG